MPNINQALNEEIRRLARKEMKTGLASLKKDNVRLKKTVVSLKQTVTRLTRENKRLLTDLAPKRGSTPTVSEDEAKTTRITGKGVKSLRSRLGLSGAQLAQLVGVSPASVGYWEGKTGSISFHGDTKAKILGLKKLGKKAVKTQLENLAAATPVKKVRRKRKAKR